MPRSAQRRRLQAWYRYVDRYIRPPHGLLGFTEPPGLIRAQMRAHRWTWVAGTRDAIAYRRSRRTRGR